jgi:hypothetical protein
MPSVTGSPRKSSSAARGIDTVTRSRVASTEPVTFLKSVLTAVPSFGVAFG